MTLSRAYRILLGVSPLFLAPAADAQVRREFTAVHMGVPVRIVLHASSENVARDAARAAFAREREHRVRPTLHAARREPREVHAEKGKARIGHGVDQVAHEMRAVVARWKSEAKALRISRDEQERMAQ